MNTIPNPDDWRDVFAIILVALIGLATSWITLRNTKTLGEVKAQVVNKHDTNLRDDLDQVIRAVDGLTVEMQRLRKDQSDEEDRRRSSDSELRHDMDRRFSDIDRRLA